MDQGERIDIALPGGPIYRALVTSAPIVREGKVVAALSIWHDFDAELRGLLEQSEPTDANGPGKPG